MVRLLVYSNDRVGRMMSGPGIRSYQFAKGLAGDHEVTLMIPNEPESEVEGVSVVRAPAPNGLGREVAQFDAVVAQYLPHAVMRQLARTETRVVYDLYVPFVSEGLGMLDGGKEAVLHWRAAMLVQRVALATGNAFVCASERQRDLWLGMLAAIGRIDPETHGTDPSLRSLVDVVPFGLPDERPEPGPRVLKGVLPGIDDDDRVLLWAGGIWNWFDPLTPIRAVERLSRDDVKLVFLGLDHPYVPRMAMADRAIELARSLGVLDRRVFFVPGWVPYGDRASFLLEADVGVSAHFDGIETRYAFRTRLLDHFWAGLPTITTGGDVLGDLVADRGLGRSVAAEDGDGWVEAIEGLLGDDDERQRIGHRLEAVRGRFAWSEVVAPLKRLARVPGRPVAAPRTVSARLEDVWLRGRISLAQRGPVATARRLVAKAGGR